MIRERMVTNTRLILAVASKEKVPLREVAMKLAQKRVQEAMERRKLHLGFR